MTAEQARAAWADIDSEMGRYNARCARTIILPTEQGAYGACIADKGRLLERQDAIRARLPRSIGVDMQAKDAAKP
ncbi:hypothetical protein [Mycobacterium camsae]|uniref:hypothetical protein n=1 Tax=Mycobacterium gordonae TaxID=1778 RepID=UPI00197D227A|nr:hypothetical protein [Mycobacterium gordonae]